MKAILARNIATATISCWPMCPIPSPSRTGGDRDQAAALNFFDILMIQASTRSSRRSPFSPARKSRA